jgi:DNA-binding NtrC family response regulator
MKALVRMIEKVAATPAMVLITGESGTGKEVVARLIHARSPRSEGPFVAVNVAGIPDTLLESELFGYERGAFTGADRSREGLLVKARGGTLFLDEVAEMPLPMQVKLLRALQEREVRPLGSNRVVPIDIRLVCATNRHLQSEVKRGTFRADLYYRIAGVEATLPPLRDRPEDIPVLVHHLLAAAARRMERSVPELSPPALRKLTQFEWPGNVRQLENVVTKALVMAEGNRITARDVELPTDDAGAATNANRDAFRQHEAERIAAALAENRWNVSRVGRLLGIPRPTLYRKLKRYGLIRAKGNR